jgi:hypothetical protein
LSGSVRAAVGPRIVALSLAATACDGIDNFDVDASGRASVEARTLIDDLIGLVPFEGLGQVDFEQEFRNQGVSEEDVDSVVVKSFVLTIESPASQTFDFLDRIAFFASAEGLPEVRLASADGIDPAARRLDLAVDEVELKPYATAARMTIRTEVTGERPEEATTLRADVVFDVDVTVPGCE